MTDLKIKVTNLAATDTVRSVREKLEDARKQFEEMNGQGDKVIGGEGGESTAVSMLEVNTSMAADEIFEDAYNEEEMSIKTTNTRTVRSIEKDKHLVVESDGEDKAAAATGEKVAAELSEEDGVGNDGEYIVGPEQLDYNFFSGSSLNTSSSSCTPRQVYRDLVPARLELEGGVHSRFE